MSSIAKSQKNDRRDSKRIGLEQDTSLNQDIQGVNIFAEINTSNAAMNTPNDLTPNESTIKAEPHLFANESSLSLQRMGL